MDDAENADEESSEEQPFQVVVDSSQRRAVETSFEVTLPVVDASERNSKKSNQGNHIFW